MLSWCQQLCPLKCTSNIFNLYLWLVGVSVAYRQPAGWKWDSGDPSVQLQQGLFKQVRPVLVQTLQVFPRWWIWTGHITVDCQLLIVGASFAISMVSWVWALNATTIDLSHWASGSLFHCGARWNESTNESVKPLYHRLLLLFSLGQIWCTGDHLSMCTKWALPKTSNRTPDIYKKGTF